MNSAIDRKKLEQLRNSAGLSQAKFGTRPPTGLGSSSGSGGRAATKETDQLYRLLENSHNMAFTGGWIIFSLMMLSLILGIGLLGGVWESVRDDLKRDDFKNYCYAVWACLGFAAVMSVGFIIYFKYHMEDVHEKGLMNINTIYGTNYKHKTDR